MKTTNLASNFGRQHHNIMPKWKAVYDRKRKFKEIWRKTYPWARAVKDGQKAYCIYCRVEVTPKLNTIAVHESSMKHRRKIRSTDFSLMNTIGDEAGNGDLINRELIELHSDRSIELDQQVMKIEIGDGSMPFNESQKRNHSDDVASQMGQYLLRGYKMLATTCNTCNCVLMEDKEGQIFCIGCNMILADETPVQHTITSKKNIQMNFDDEVLESELSNENDTFEKSNKKHCTVQGVDLSSELTTTVQSLKVKLASLSLQLEKISDYNEINICLASMSSTVSVLEKIKNL